MDVFENEQSEKKEEHCNISQDHSVTGEADILGVMVGA